MVTFDNEFRFKSELEKNGQLVKNVFFLEPMIRTSYKNQTLSRCFFSKKSQELKVLKL